MLIEDNETTSRTLVLFLESEGYEVDCANNGRHGQTLFSERSYELIVLDLMLPDIDGLSVCRFVRQTSPVPIVMLTAKTTEEEIVEGLEMGADDYVCKPFGSKELLARIRRCLARQYRKRNAGAKIRLGDLTVNLETRVVKMQDEPVHLTKSEFELLSVLADNPGRVFTRDQLISSALGDDFDGFDRTIDTHIWSLRKKLGEKKGSPKYILSELGVGYRMNDSYAQ